MCRQSLGTALRVGPKDGWAEAPAIAKGFKADLIIFVRDEGPNTIEKFRTA